MNDIVITWWMGLMNVPSMGSYPMNAHFEIERSKQSNSTFAFWVNDDNDSGDTNSSENDLPGSGGNGADLQVNGRGDLLDFTPLLLDTSAVFPAAMPAKIQNYVNERITWKLQSPAVNALFTKLTPSTAGSFRGNLETPFFAAFVARIAQFSAAL